MLTHLLLALLCLTLGAYLGFRAAQVGARGMAIAEAHRIAAGWRMAEAGRVADLEDALARALRQAEAHRRAFDRLALDAAVASSPGLLAAAEGLRAALDQATQPPATPAENPER